MKVQADGHAEGRFGPFDPLQLPEQAVFRLDPIGQVTGIVRHGGRPVPGAQVELYAAIGSGQIVFNRGFQVRHYPFSFQSATTDAEGRYALTPRETNDFVLRAAHDGLAPAEHEVRGYDTLRGLEVDFELGTGGTVHGVVRALPGEEPTGLLVAASRGDANERTVRVGPDGAFRFEHLTPGRWRWWRW